MNQNFKQPRSQANLCDVVDCDTGISQSKTSREINNGNRNSLGSAAAIPVETSLSL